jgi:1-deoxyxylulose-5-phosphate synthase
MNRRHFLRAGALGAISLNSFPYRLFAGESKKQGTDRITLGPRKIQLSRLAMGTGTHGGNGSSNQTRKLGYQGVAELLRAGYDQGVNFWDSADQYGSHTYLREALKTVPRDKVVILTKTNATSADGVKADIDRFRRELGTDYIDILLMHKMMDSD